MLWSTKQCLAIRSIAFEITASWLLCILLAIPISYTQKQKKKPKPKWSYFTTWVQWSFVGSGLLPHIQVNEKLPNTLKTLQSFRKAAGF